MAFDYFHDQRVDIAIIETGLGGRLDSTNVIYPELSVITNIGMDHMNLLGDSLEKIAGKKAGIIQRKRPCSLRRSATAKQDQCLKKSQKQSMRRPLLLHKEDRRSIGNGRNMN